MACLAGVCGLDEADLEGVSGLDEAGVAVCFAALLSATLSKMKTCAHQTKANMKSTRRKNEKL